MERIIAAKISKAICIVLVIMVIMLACAPLTANAAADSARITVSQIFIASEGAGTFTYRLEALETGNPMPAGSTDDGYTFTITGSGSAVIELAAFNRQGVYRYKLFQVIGNEKPGYTYDRRVYTIEIHAGTEPDAKVIVFDENGEKTAAIIFQNSYGVLPSDPDLMDDLPVRKTVFGSPDRSRTFEFRLVAGDSSNPMPPGSADGMKSVYITGSGRNEFGVWSYDKAGTYYYTVYEANTGGIGYTYDTAVYTITDMVNADNGRLEVTRVVTNDTNRLVTSYIFNNYYTSGETTSPPPTNPPTNPPTTEIPPTEPPTTELPPTNPPTEPPTTEIPTTEPPATEIPPIDPPTTDIPPTDPPTTELPPAGSQGGGKDGGAGPKTGDESKYELYIGLFASGAAVSVSAAIYLITGVKCDRRRRQT